MKFQRQLDRNFQYLEGKKKKGIWLQTILNISITSTEVWNNIADVTWRWEAGVYVASFFFVFLLKYWLQ